MTDNPSGLPSIMPPGGPVSDRMQALLSWAVEEQVNEQRAVSSVLGDLRTQVTALTEGIRLTASDAAVERLGGVLSTVVADLRTSTSLLGQRIEALTERVDAVAIEAAAPTERAAVRLIALQADIDTQADSVERIQSALEVLAGFPDALASLQRDVAGLHDRLQPLGEVRSSLGDLGVRTASSLDALRPQLAALSAKVDALGEGNAPERVTDAIIDALSGRLDRLEQAADRPVVGPEALRSGLGDLRASLDGAMGNRLEQLGAALAAVENRLGQVGERLADVGDAAGGIPALATDLARLATRVEQLQVLRDQVGLVGQGVNALRDDSTGRTLSLGIASLRDDLVSLGEWVAQSAPPPAEDVAGLVSRSVADRLVETLAPRIADVVLTRVSAALVAQLGEALSPRLTMDTEAVVRTVTADSERRVLAHVDEAVLALAEALLRRRRGGRAGGLALGRPVEEALPAGATGAAGAAGAAGSVAGAGPVGDPALPDTSLKEVRVDRKDEGDAPPPAAPADDVGAAEFRHAEPVVSEPVAVEPAEGSRAPVGSPEKRPLVTTGLAPTFERTTVPAPVASAVPEASAVPASVLVVPVSLAAVVSPSAPASAAAPAAPSGRAHGDPATPAHDTDWAGQDVGQDAGQEQPDAPGRPAVNPEPELASESTSPSTSVTQSAAAAKGAMLAAPGVEESSAPEPRATDLADTGLDPLQPAIRTRPADRSEPVDADVPEAAPASTPPPPAAERASRPVTWATTRPATKPPAKPILERTPEVRDDDLDLLRSAGGPRPETRPVRVSPPSPPSPPSSTQAGLAPRELSIPRRPPTAAQVRPGATSVRSPAPEPEAAELEAPGPQAATSPSPEAGQSQVQRPESACSEVRLPVTPEKGSAPPQPSVWHHLQPAADSPTSQPDSDQLPYAPDRPAKRKPWWRPGG